MKRETKYLRRVFSCAFSFPTRCAPFKRHEFHLESRRPRGRVPGISDIYNRETRLALKDPILGLAEAGPVLDLARETTDTCRVKSHRPSALARPRRPVPLRLVLPSPLPRNVLPLSRHSIPASHFPFSAFKRSVNIPNDIVFPFSRRLSERPVRIR